MDRSQRIIQMETTHGTPVQVNGQIVTPISQALRLNFGRGGFVWNRPVAVQVERGAVVERIPIIDMTRIAQLSLLGVGLATSLLIWLAGRRQGRQPKDN
jgi:hypothetical protein